MRSAERSCCVTSHAYAEYYLPPTTMKSYVVAMSHLTKKPWGRRRATSTKDTEVIEIGNGQSLNEKEKTTCISYIIHRLSCS